MDLMPTILAATGANYPKEFHGHAILPEEGINLLPVIEGQPTIPRPVPLCWEHEGNSAVREGHWKLVSHYPDYWELHNMELDRTEMVNLIDKDPDRVQRMQTLYREWAKRVRCRPAKSD